MIDYEAARIAMVDGQIRPSDVTLYPVIEALLTIPREVFVPGDKRAIAYMGEHIDLGNGRVVLAPRILGKMLEELGIQPNELVLDVGATLGYSSAVIAHLAEAVIAIEEDSAMAASADTNLSEQSVDNAFVIKGELAKGAKKHGPYDVIIVSGGVEVLPKALLDQLKTGGRIAVLLMKGGAGSCRIGLKGENGINWRSAFDVTVPVLPGFAGEKVFEL